MHCKLWWMNYISWLFKKSNLIRKQHFFFYFLSCCRSSRLRSSCRQLTLSHESIIKWLYKCRQISLPDLIWCHINSLSTLDSISVNLFSYCFKVIEGLGDMKSEVLRRKTTTKPQKSASWHPMTSALGQKSLPSSLARCLSLSDFATGATGVVCVLHWL